MTAPLSRSLAGRHPGAAGTAQRACAQDLPLERIKLPPGFEIEVYAAGARAPARWRWATRARCSSAPAETAASTPSLPGKAASRKSSPSRDGLNAPTAWRSATVRCTWPKSAASCATTTSKRTCAIRPSRWSSPTAFRGWPSRLEVHRLRSRRLAVRAGRRAVQRLRAGPGSLRADLAHQARRQRLRSVRARHPQHGRLRLGPAHRRAVVQRPRPRHDGRRHALRRAEPCAQGRACTSAFRTATRATRPIRSSAPSTRAPSSRRPR